MGCDTAKRLASLGIKRARTEKTVTEEYQHGCQDDNRQTTNYDA
jgi:hypothetical protein